MGSKSSSSSTSSSTTNQTDNSAVAGNNATALAAGASFTNWNDSDTLSSYNYSDSSRTDRSYHSSDLWMDQSITDSRNQSITDNSSRDQSITDNSSRDQSITDNSSRYSYSDTSSRDSRDQSQSWYAVDSSDRSVTATDDRSWYSYASDSSDRSTTTNTTNWTGVDPGAVQFARLGAELVGAVNESQSDGIRYMTQLGADGIRQMGDSVTDLYARAGSNTTASWGATVAAQERVINNTAAALGAAWADTMDTSAGLLSQITQRAGNTADAAARLADTAISSYQPPAGQQSQALKWGAMAAAGVALLVIVPKLMK